MAHPEQKLIDRLRCIPAGTAVRVLPWPGMLSFARVFGTGAGGYYYVGNTQRLGLFNRSKLAIERTYHGTRT